MRVRWCDAATAAKRLAGSSGRFGRRPGALRHRLRAIFGAAIVVVSAGTVASMVASIVLGPFGDQVLARDGYSNRDYYTPAETGVVAAIFHPSPAALPAPAWTERERARHRFAGEPWSRHRTAGRTVARFASVSSPSRGHSVCVRLCDGFFFPVGDVHGAGDVETQTAVCSSACPGAPTRLFVVPSSDTDMDKAVAVQTGKPYTALPVAYAHQAGVGPTCTCHAEGQGEAALMSPMRDITMRDGDSVMSPVGWRVFRANGHWPYTQQNFTGLAAAKDIPSKVRSTLASIENATLGRLVPHRTATAVLDVRGRKTAPSLRLKDADGHMVRLIGTDQPIYR